MDTLIARPTHEGRRQHRSRVEQAILGATQALLSDRAASDVTIADIMDVVGLSRTAFYRYFPDVHSVLIRLLRDVQSQFVVTWLEAPDDADFTEVLRNDAHANLERFARHGAILRACLDAGPNAPELHAAWHQVVEEVVQHAATRIEGLNRRGVTQVQCATETARALVTFTIYYVAEGLGRRADVQGREALAETLRAVWFRTIFGIG